MEVKQQPLVSVLLPVYNQSETIITTLQSVLNQTYQHIEVLILDDVSTDDSTEIIRSFIAKLPNEDQGKIRYLRNKTNLRLQKNLNRGLKEARGELIARIDGDDQWTTPDKLERQVNFLIDHPDYALVGGWVVEHKSDGSEVIHRKPETDEQIRQSMLIENPFGHGSVVFRRDALPGLHYNESTTRTEDYELWMRIGLNRKLYNFPEVFQARHDFARDDSKKFRRESARTIRLRELKESLQLILEYRNNYPNAYRGMINALKRFIAGFLSAKARSMLKRMI